MNVWHRTLNSKSEGFHFYGFRNDIFFLQSKVVSLVSNPRPGGPGLCIYVSQWHDGPVISRRHRSSALRPIPDLEDQDSVFMSPSDMMAQLYPAGIGRQPCVQSQTWRTRSLYLCLPVTWWPSYTPQAPGSLFIALYDSQGYGGGILTRLHSGPK
jgi:hypothetical protein